MRAYSNESNHEKKEGNQMKKGIGTVLFSIYCVFTLNACSTIEGAGKDLQNAGKIISKEAQKAKF